MSAAARYAVYYAPAAASAWWHFGAGWLGRDERSGSPLVAPVPAGVHPADFAHMTAEPRRYGFHATLKAPFRLAAGVDQAGLRERVAVLASRLRALPLGRLVAVHMDGFVALVPADPNPALQALAGQCVTELDDLRAPLDAAELARRRPHLLDDRGRELLERHGYPHVLERYRFHMTLSGPVDPATAGTLVAHLAPQVARLNATEPPRLDRLCLFGEPAPGAPFLRLYEELLA